MRAAKSGDHSKVLKLLMDGADPNTKEIDAVKHLKVPKGHEWHALIYPHRSSGLH